MSVALSNPTNNVVQVNGTGGILISSVIKDGAGNALTVNSSGAGALTLSGVNTYSGGTTATAGTLLVNTPVSGANSGTGTGAVAVNGGTLGGNGAVGNATTGAVTVAGGATIQGGTATGTALTTLGALTLSDNSAIQLYLGASGAHSTLATSSAGTTFDNDQAFTFLGAGAAPGTYNDIITGLTADPNTTGAWTITNSGYMGTFVYDAGTIDLTLTAVPEPATVFGGLLIVGLLGWSLRRRIGGWLAAAQPRGAGTPA